MSDPIAIEVRGARTHNLKHVDCSIPHGQVTVVTGPSGAGKSSLAFDTVYAEAQRRFVESMSTYARQFLEQMERPPVDAIDHVLPAIALEAHNPVRNARSTVGTRTEVHDVLRLLYAHLGEVECPNGHGTVHSWSSEEVASDLIERWQGQPLTLLVAIDRPPKRADDRLRELIRQGYFRRLHGDDVVDMKPSQRWLVALDPMLLVLGRYKPSERSRARLSEAIEEAFMLAAGKLQVRLANGDHHHYGRSLTCRTCGERLEQPTAGLFSFNSPLGACSTCQGFGRVLGIDPERVVPDHSKSLEEHPIAPWNSKSRRKYYSKLLSACRQHGIPTNVPWRELSADDRDFVWRGKGSFTSLDKFFARVQRKIYKMHLRILLARYRSYETCPQCRGQRLRAQALAVKLHGLDIAELSKLSVRRLRIWLTERTWPRRQEAAGLLVEQLEQRLETLDRVGLDYLSLDRQARTLSGGESQRIHLASALGSGLTGTLYVLDEPTIGLHPKDSDRLLALMHDLAARGNTVLVVEHDRTVIEGADHLIDVGPKAGEHGGEIVDQGATERVLAGDGLTATSLRRAAQKRARGELEHAAARVAELPRVLIHGARAHNLQNIDVELPIGCLSAVVGVSGSGKSTLVESVLYANYQRAKGVVDVDPGACDSLEGVEQLADIVLVDQRPLGRSSRSNPATYSKAYDDVRRLFAATPDAKRQGIEAGHFSFNLDRGRCEACKGTGIQEVDMHFMAPINVTCESCGGKRFKPQVLAVKLRGRNIFETLEMTISEALDVFDDQKPMCRKLQTLVSVGLGYLRLGQPTSTLSGGEAQRLKLASFLAEKAGDERRLFLFDEPTTGLHLADIELLVDAFQKLTDRGHGVVVVEHATDLIARADWLVDLGPGGGSRGGELLYSGPMLGFLDQAGSSPTAQALRRHVRWRRRSAKAKARARA